MFGFSVVVGTIQLLAAWGCFVLVRGGGGASTLAAIVLGVIDMFILGFSGTVPFLQGIGLLCLGLLFLALKCRPRSFVFASTGLSIVA